MKQYIEKSALLEEIERIDEFKQDIYKAKETRISFEAGKGYALTEIRIFVESYELRDFDSRTEKEAYDRERKN